MHFNPVRSLHANIIEGSLFSLLAKIQVGNCWTLFVLNYWRWNIQKAHQLYKDSHWLYRTAKHFLKYLHLCQKHLKLESETESNLILIVILIARLIFDILTYSFGLLQISLKSANKATWSSETLSWLSLTMIGHSYMRCSSTCMHYNERLRPSALIELMDSLNYITRRINRCSSLYDSIRLHGNASWVRILTTIKNITLSTISRKNAH